MTFVDDMVRQIEGGLCVDTTQLFSAGFSYGGAMTYALACARATVFRAVAVYSGANLSGCSGGTQPIAYMGLHGLRDNVLPISSGRALRDTFVRNNGCTSQNPPEPANGSLTHIVTAYSGCRSGYPVVWAAFDGAATTPVPIDGSTGDGWRTWTSAAVWKFFTQFDGYRRHQPAADHSAVRRRPGDRRASSRAAASTSTNSATANGTQAQLWDCNGGTNQRWTYTAGKQLHGLRQQVPGRLRPGHRQRHPGGRSGTATGRPTSSGTSTPTARSPECSPGCAWTRTARVPPTERRSSCGAARAAPTSSGACRTDRPGPG